MNYRLRNDGDLLVLQVYTQIPERSRPYPSAPPMRGSMEWAWIDAKLEHLSEGLFDDPAYTLTDAGRAHLEGKK